MTDAHRTEDPPTILKRLKNWPKLELGGVNLGSIQKVMKEAAVEIERQQREIKRLEKTVERYADASVEDGNV